MRLFKYKQEEIYQYLEQKLSKDKKVEFEAYMSQNSEFKKEVEFSAFVIHKNRQEKRKQFAAIRENHKKTKTVYLKWWKVAAVFVLAIGLGIISYPYFGQQSAQQLALQQWQTPKQWSSTRMGEETTSDLQEELKAIYQEAYQTFEQQKEQETLSVLEKMPMSDEAKQTKTWLLSKELEAHIYFEQKKYQQAATIYENLLQQDMEGKGQAKIKLALCYIADGQAQKAKPILEELLQLEQLKPQAEKLLKALK